MSPSTLCLQLEAVAYLESAVAFAGGDLVEALGEVDLHVEGAEPVEIRTVFALPSSPLRANWSLQLTWVDPH